jgi:hypothetical protein
MKQVDRLFTSSGIDCVKVHSFRLRESIEVLKSFLVSHITLIFLIRCADDLKDDSKLVIL